MNSLVNEIKLIESTKLNKYRDTDLRGWDVGPREQP
jgi:hypothetical protein